MLINVEKMFLAKKDLDKISKRKNVYKKDGRTVVGKWTYNHELDVQRARQQLINVVGEIKGEMKNV